MKNLFRKKIKIGIVFPIFLLFSLATLFIFHAQNAQSTPGSVCGTPTAERCLNSNNCSVETCQRPSPESPGVCVIDSYSSSCSCGTESNHLGNGRCEPFLGENSNDNSECSTGSLGRTLTCSITTPPSSNLDGCCPTQFATTTLGIPDPDCCIAPNTCGDARVTAPEQCDPGADHIGPNKACLPGCILNVCGDGDRSPTEECDNGSTGPNANGNDNCSTTCTIPRCEDHSLNRSNETCETLEGGAVVTRNATLLTRNCRSATSPAPCTYCGDTILNATAGETCDDGLNNGNPSSVCKSDCAINTCGDGHVGRLIEGKTIRDEQCDDGNRIDTDACRNDCRTATCGDGAVQAGVEICDDGNRNDNDACRNSCQPATCGDGALQAGVEQCDDGNIVNGDGCEANCTIPSCGNAIRESGEDCDDGNTNNNDACTNSCRNAGCGDGFVHTVANGGTEECDAGRLNGTENSCTGDCRNPVCGDGTINRTVEQCDSRDGVSRFRITPPTGNACRLTGTESCTYCGDGIKQDSEACDLGSNNGQTGFNCTNSCNIPPRCGDGTIDTSTGEQCDLGDANNTGLPNASGQSCNPTCTNVTCGDGFIRSGETCDGSATSSDLGFLNLEGCRPATSPLNPSSCTYCGDGIKQSVEACDPNDPNRTGCSTGQNCVINATGSGCGTCVTPPPLCGNKILDAGEGCDLGTTTNSEGILCNSDCTLPRCGDGRINQGAETCEFDSSGAALTAGCRARATTDECTVCGDTVRQASETCDPTAPASANGCSNGQSCVADATSCGRCVSPPPLCGNGTLDSGEVCDPNAATSSCNNSSFCTSACTCQANPVVDAPNCGDRIVEGAECEAPNTSTCDANCRTIPVITPVVTAPVAPPATTPAAETPPPPGSEILNLQGSGGCSLSTLGTSNSAFFLTLFSVLLGLTFCRFKKK